MFTIILEVLFWIFQFLTRDWPKDCGPQYGVRLNIKRSRFVWKGLFNKLCLTLLGDIWRIIWTDFVGQWLWKSQWPSNLLWENAANSSLRHVALLSIRNRQKQKNNYCLLKEALNRGEREGEKSAIIEERSLQWIQEFFQRQLRQSHFRKPLPRSTWCLPSSAIFCWTF